MFFLKWPRSHQLWARDGQPHLQTGKLLKFTKPQVKPKEEEDRLKMKEKLDKVCSQMYIEHATVFSLSHIFYVCEQGDK